MDVTNRNSVKPFVTKDGSTIREILAPRNSQLKAQSLAEATLPPGAATEAHYHPLTEEIYYILSGHGTMRIGQEERSVGRHDAIAIPPGSVHQIHNSGERNLVFLCCCAPAYEHEDTVLVPSLFATHTP